MEADLTAISELEVSDSHRLKKSKILTLLLPADNKELKKEKNKPPTKVIIRRLPPRLTEENLLKELSPIPDYDYFKFTRGDLTLGVNAFSRAYFNFARQEDIFAFKDKFDDYVFKDDKGKEFHAVVEFSPFQRIPRKQPSKRKTPKIGTLETDPKYIEFLKKLEEAKIAATNTSSEYFHETDSLTSKPKVTTTPLLEYLKQKKQKKIDTKNEARQRMREAEWEKRKKEEERRRLKRDKKKEERLEKRSNREEKSNERIQNNEKDQLSENLTKLQLEDKNNKKSNVNKNNVDSCASVAIDPSILKVIIKPTDGEEKRSPAKLTTSNTNNPTTTRLADKQNVKETVSDSGISKTRKYSEFRSKNYEEKQRRLKTVEPTKHGRPDERGDNTSVGKKTESKNNEVVGGRSSKSSETKSWYRYSEQRNRDREYRNMKTSDCKENKKDVAVVTTTSCEGDGDGKQKHSSDAKRRKSLDMDSIENVVNECRRTKSLHDVNESQVKDEKNFKNEMVDDCNVKENEDLRKDPRAERRIRNKDRPSIEIYRPGMGKFSKQRIENIKEDSGNVSPTNSQKYTRKTTKKNLETCSDYSDIKSDESIENNKSNEIRSMTFKRKK